VSPSLMGIMMKRMFMMEPISMMKIMVTIIEVKVARGISVIIIIVWVIIIPIGGVVSYTTRQRQCGEKHKRNEHDFDIHKSHVLPFTSVVIPA